MIHFIKDFILKIFLTEKKVTTFPKHAYERPNFRKSQKIEKKVKIDDFFSKDAYK